MDCIALQQSLYSNPVIEAEILVESKYLIRQVNYCDIFKLCKRWRISCVCEITTENATLKTC